MAGPISIFSTVKFTRINRVLESVNKNYKKYLFQNVVMEVHFQEKSPKFHKCFKIVKLHSRTILV